MVIACVVGLDILALVRPSRGVGVLVTVGSPVSVIVVIPNLGRNETGLIVLPAMVPMVRLGLNRLP